MAINFRYVLVLLCIVFGTLYFVWSEFRDLTANLLAALIAVLFIDWIVERSKLQKTERSVNYIKRRITSVYLDLIWRMRPPKDWGERLKKKNSNWDDYYGKVWSLKEDALHSLETLLDRYHHLLDAELTNDVLEMVGLLNHPTTWMMADPNVARALIEKKDADLYSVASSVTNVVFQSINTIKRHKLVEDSEHRVITSRRGEPPKMRREKLTYASASTLKKRHYAFFEQLLKECIRFRDECWNSVFPKPKENKK